MHQSFKSTPTVSLDKCQERFNQPPTVSLNISQSFVGRPFCRTCDFGAGRYVVPLQKRPISDRPLCPRPFCPHAVLSGRFVHRPFCRFTNVLGVCVGFYAKFVDSLEINSNTKLNATEWIAKEMMSISWILIICNSNNTASWPSPWPLHCRPCGTWRWRSARSCWWLLPWCRRRAKNRRRPTPQSHADRLNGASRSVQREFVIDEARWTWLAVGFKLNFLILVASDTITVNAAITQRGASSMTALPVLKSSQHVVSFV